MTDLISAIEKVQLFQPQRSSRHSLDILGTRLSSDHWIWALHHQGTPEPETGEDIFFQKTGVKWPYEGWWSKPESLDMNIFDMPINQFTYRKYLEAISDEDNYLVLATGRIDKLRKEVEKILIHHNFSFDEIHLNNMGDTFKFKKTLFQNLIQKHKPQKFVMYDDRKAHIELFKDWAKTQPCEIHIIDVTTKDKKPYIIKNLNQN